jgi:mono/diheme cytochrome c family protein
VNRAQRPTNRDLEQVAWLISKLLTEEKAMPIATNLLLTASLVLVCGCRVSKPGAAESEMAKQVKHKITVGGKNDTNPIPATEANITDGREHFGHHCGVCHGLDGQATGVPFADKMSPPVPSLASKDVQDYTDGQLKWIIENGINPSGMPAWKGNLSDEEMWKVVNFLRHLPPKGSLGIPDVYKEAEEEHEHMHHK